MDSRPVRRAPPPTWARHAPSWARLGASLARFDERFPREARRLADPVSVVHGYPRDADREIAALVAAGLAFGRAAAIIDKTRRALEPFGPDLAARIEALEASGLPPHLDSFVHRWVRGGDLHDLLLGASRLLREHGSLGAAFRAGLRRDDPPGHLLPAMRRFAEAIWAPTSRRRDARPPALLGIPDGHAASKRWCLFLRWMVRPADGVDLGLWEDVGASRLTIPLDTHVARIGGYIGLTDRRTPGWAMAREITARLARWHPEDPTRLDFALSHLGIMGGCPRRRDPVRCRACDLVGACRL